MMNQFNNKITGMLASGAMVVLACHAWGAGVAVGSSSLINDLDYSDSFTLTANGGAADRIAGAYPVSATGRIVENGYGNPSRTWTEYKWSLNDSTPIPGHSGAGSATGYTGTGGAQGWGIEYGLSRDFILQVDAVQTTERIYLATGNTRDTHVNADGLTVFFNATGAVELYNPSVAHTTALSGSSITPGTWHNYAVWFHLDSKTLDVYLDQTLRGTINLNTFFSGGFTNIINAATDDAVTVGFTGDASGGAFGGTPVTWTDNFQVGVPEPTAAMLALTAAGILRLRLRRRA